MKFTIEDKSAIVLIVFSIALLLFVYNGSALEKNGITVKLISNTDRCEDCKTVYNVCLDNILTSSEITDYKFLFSDELIKEQTTLSSLKTVPNITYKLDKTGLCYDVTISAKKSPFANIDNILCFGSTCFNEFVWWNSSCTPRYAISSKAMLDALFSINDSALFYNTQIWTTNVTGGIYVYNCSNVFVVGNETDKLNYEIVNGATLSGNNPTSNYERLLNRTWHLENNGTVIPDSTINNINCVQNSTSIGVVNGVFGKALDFSQGTLQNKLNCSATPLITDNITVEAWAYIKSFSSDYFTIVSKPQDIGATKGWGAGWGLVGGKAIGGIRFFINAFNTNYAINSSVVNLNSWHYFVGTYEKTNTSNQIKLYIDGILQTPDTFTSDITDQTGTPISIGGGIFGTGESVNGYIDEVRIYNRVLRENEILNHYWNGINNLTSIYGSEYYVYPFCNYTFNVVDNVTSMQLTNVTLIGDFANFTNVNSPFSSNNITDGVHNFSVDALGYFGLNTSLNCNTTRPTTNMTIALGMIPVIPPINITIGNITGNICCPDWNLATLSVCYNNETLYQEYSEIRCLNGICENSTATRFVNCPYGCVAEINQLGDGCIVPNYQLDFLFILIIAIIILIAVIIWKKG